MNKRPLKMSILFVLCEMSNISLFVYHNEEYLFGFGWCIMDFCNFTAI